MPTIIHHTLVCTGYEDHIKSLHKIATELVHNTKLGKSCGCSVSNITPSFWNGYSTFMIGPDGSRGQTLNLLTIFLQKYVYPISDSMNDNECAIDFVLIEYGEANRAKIVADHITHNELMRQLKP